MNKRLQEKESEIGCVRDRKRVRRRSGERTSEEKSTRR